MNVFAIYLHDVFQYWMCYGIVLGLSALTWVRFAQHNHLDGLRACPKTTFQRLCYDIPESSADTRHLFPVWYSQLE